VLASTVAVAGTATADPPQLYSRISYFTAASPKLEIESFVQFAPPDSIDLVQLAPQAAAVQRIEATIHPDQLILHPRQLDPRIYRVRVPVGSPISCNYTVNLKSDPAARHVVGPDYACVWLGELLLAPLRPEKLSRDTPVGASTLDATSGAEQFWLEMRVLDGWRAVGPWRKQEKAYRPASLADQIDNFVALGNWRVTLEQQAAPCTLHVALAGQMSVADLAWRERAAREVTSAGIDGRALVCVAPTSGALQVLRARRSWLVLWPADRAALPAETQPAATPKREPFAWEP
jgi:hypothetical protein